MQHSTHVRAGARQRLFAAAAASLLAATVARAQQPESRAAPSASVRTLSFESSEATWMAISLSPDGRELFFDLLGDVYALDARQGGSARPVLRGPAFETHPVVSPDGRLFAFLSDRSGSNNLWIANRDGTGLRQLSQDTGSAFYSSPAWSPDGRSVYVSRTVHSILAFELHMFDIAGGAGVRITTADPSGHASFDERHNALGAVTSPDGRYLYYATKHGATWSQQDVPHWSIARRDLRSGEENILVASHGGAMRPALSPDGKRLAYASRHGQQTGIRLRDLQTGDDRWIAFPMDPDGQIGGYYSDLLPRFVFSSAGDALFLGVDGGIQRLDLSSGVRSRIPFKAPVELAVGASTRVQQVEETGPVTVRVIQAPRQSPDGKAIAFAALGGVYVQSLKGDAAPGRISDAAIPAFQPAWSPDGRSIAFVTWTASDGGHLWKVASSGGKPRRLTTHAAFYSEPVFTPDGRAVVALRSSHYDRLRDFSEIAFGPFGGARASDVVRVAAAGGPTEILTSAPGARALGFGAERDRLRYYTGAGVRSIRLDGSDVRQLVSAVARSPSQYVGVPEPATEIRLNPGGGWALVRTASQLYLVAVPPANGAVAPVIDLAGPTVSARKLTRIGADYFDWADEGRSITWSVGSTFRRASLEEALQEGEKSLEERAQSFRVQLHLPRDVPRGALVLRGGTAITMRGDEVIDDADVVVADGRIVAVGPKGTVTVPAGAAVRDISGSYLVPGLVDTHAHWFSIRRELIELQHWALLANLAYGVTSGLDVQPFTVDAFAYQDAIDAGLMLGPRAWSTGPGVFVNSEINSRQDAVAVLTRYRDYYRTRNIKSYMVGSRRQRGFMIEAARELGMMPTTEGASDLWLNLTHAVDGFAGNEHSLPITPLRDDVIRLYADTRIGYTPTLSVLYGGWPALDDLIIRERPQDDAKLARFTPPDVIQDKLRNRHWIPPEARTYQSFARDAVRIQRAGGLVGMGSHGEVQGLGYHWELEVYASGGATPREVLQAATIGSSEVIGRAKEIGSLEPGKFADILVLTKDPLKNIRNTRALREVMKNGRLYDADTLNEVWPRQRPLGRLWFDRQDVPVENAPR
jgi:Tol biopolymer transport system component